MTTNDDASAELNREIHRFSLRTLDLAKKTVDGTISDEERETARSLAAQLPEFAARARELNDTYRPGANKALADARLDLAYVAAGGGIPSSIRLGHYISEHDAAAGA